MRLVFYVLTVFLVVIFAEIASFLAVEFLKTKNAFYVPSPSKSFHDYVSKRDDVLGWPSPDEYGKGKFDLSGSRVVPAFPDENENESCISLYGDSFTWSDEVAHEYAWGNILSQLLGCRVANYGVIAYGSDQAYLRFLQNTDDNSPIVFLNHFSENVLRNANQFRDLLHPEGGLGFKPRFTLNPQGSLELIPLPKFSSDKYSDVVSRPHKYLKDDYFIPGGSSGITYASFPYTLSIFRSLNNFRIRAELLGEPYYTEFYSEDHPSRSLAITSEILRSFHDNAIKRGRTPILTVIPSGLDLVYYLEKRTWPYENLVMEMSKRNIDIFNFGPGILQQLNNRDPCSLFNNCSSHFNEKGYQLLAELAYELLSERQLLVEIQADTGKAHQEELGPSEVGVSF